MKKITTKLPEAKFIYGNPNNFVVCWNGLTFGAMESRPFNNGKFESKFREIEWTNREIFFIESLLERVKRYRTLLGES
jgi:hypothetical protein